MMSKYRNNVVGQCHCRLILSSAKIIVDKTIVDEICVDDFNGSRCSLSGRRLGRRGLATDRIAPLAAYGWP